MSTQVPNASPTAASASSDMYGAAVLDACEQLKARMQPIASKHNINSFAEVSILPFLVMISLKLCYDLKFDNSFDIQLRNVSILLKKLYR